MGSQSVTVGSESTMLSAAVLSELLVLTVLTHHVEAGLLGAGTGHGSCPAFPNRSDDIDHIGGCPKYAECCTEYGYCHPLDSWEKGYFRDCNGKSNGQPLPGSVIRLEAEQAALGNSQLSADFLGISQEIWQSQVQKATTLLSVSSSSSSSSQTSSSLSSSFNSQQSSSSLSSSALIQQILAAIQPQVALAVQSAVGSSSSSFDANKISSSSSLSGGSQLGSTSSFSGGSQLGSTSSFPGGLEFNSLNSNSLSDNRLSFSNNQGSSSSSSGGQFLTSSSLSNNINDNRVTEFSGLDASRIVSLVIAQLTPQIAEAVESASLG